MNTARSLIAEWPEGARLLAERMIQEYGVPDVMSAARLTWRQRSPWTESIALRDAESSEHPNRLIQSVTYEVPPRRWRALSAFDRGVTYDPIRRELVARSDREETNILALNLADQVIQDRRTPQDAASFYDKALDAARAGGPLDESRRLLFSPSSRRVFKRDGTRDFDLELERERFQR